MIAREYTILKSYRYITLHKISKRYDKMMTELTSVIENCSTCEYNPSVSGRKYLGVWNNHKCFYFNAGQKICKHWRQKREV